MRVRLIPWALAVLLCPGVHSQAKTRLVILADMGNEPDEMQQMAHMLVCSNSFELEGLIAVTGKFLHPGRESPRKRKTQPELFLELIDAYEQVLPTLRRHADGWPDPVYLRSITRSGQPGYGIADVGASRTSEGAQLILDVLSKPDPRPVWVVVNAGSNTLAQALYVLKTTRPAHEVRRAVAKLRVFENGSQDNSGAWIASEFPEIHWIRSNYQTYAYGGPGGGAGQAGRVAGPHEWEPFEYSVEGQHEWVRRHIQTGHGPLGAKYPDRRFERGGLGFIEGGGTVPWLGLVNRGLFDINEPAWGGWSGRFTRGKVADFWSRHADIRPDEERFAPFYTYREASDVWTDPKDGKTYEGDYVPVWRFRQAMYSDFRARMDWCVNSYSEANHHPIAAVDGDSSDAIVRISTNPGRELAFDASASSDPDGDNLEFRWWIYQEAGTYPGRVLVHGESGPTASLSVPTGARDHQIHLILEVQDDHPEVRLTDYRRIVLDVSSREPWSESPQGRGRERPSLLPIPRP